jgi:anti-sigma B factor antagonist
LGVLSSRSAIAGGLDCRLQSLAMPSESLLVDRFAPGVEGQGVICLRGPLTFETRGVFQSAVRGESAGTVFLDLTDVPYVDSAGLGSLVSAHVTLHKSGHHLVLSGINARVLKLIEITHVDSLFLMFSTLADAMQAVSNSARA